MAEQVDPKQVAELLDEETEEEKQFQEQLSQQQLDSLSPVAWIGMRHSATTDTLDSVYLDPLPAEQDSDTELAKVVQHVEEIQGTEEVGLVLNTVVKDVKEVAALEVKEDPKLSEEIAEDVTHEKPSVDDLQNIKTVPIENTEEANALQESPPSLSKYFGKETSLDDPFATNVFDTFGGPETKNELQDGTDELIEKGIENEMSNLALDDSNDMLADSKEEMLKEENTNNNHRRSEELKVDFDLALDNTEPVETPVDIEGKDDFESFTAYAADTEALDALGMSPAAPSYMTEKNITDYFRQTSQADSIHSLGIGRQLSVSSGKSSSLGPGTIAETLEEGSDNGSLQPSSIPPHVDQSESSLPAPDMSPFAVLKNEAESKIQGSVESTPTHQPVFPPSTTLSPVDSPVHQPSFNRATERQTSMNSIPASPEHLVTAFQNVADTGDDAFTVGLQMSDSDRQHDAWLPSEATKNILIAMATHPPGTYLPDRELLCSPTLVITDSQGDPVRDLVYRYMGEQEALKRQILTANKVTQDAEGLKKLMANGCYRSAIDLTGKLLADIGQAEPGEKPTFHTPETLQLWHCRFSLMMKLRMYSVMESEFVFFQNLDTPDMYYEFYPQHFPGKRGSMVSFGMRLLHAELPHHLGRSQETLDRLYYILAITNKILKNLEEGLAEDGSAVTISAESRRVSQKLWEERERRVLYLIGNILVSLRDYDAALSVYETLMEKDEPHKTALLSGIGRIHLQIGNLSKAAEYFRQVQLAGDTTTSSTNTTLYMNKGFEAMCQNNFNEAYQNFKRAVEADPGNTSAVNNMAVCCLYLGRLSDALKSLEALVHSNPDKNLHEGILFNLCTLYELESSRALHKKQALLDLVSKHKGDGFPVVCLKMA